MIKIHATKKLLGKLPLNDGGMLANTQVDANTSSKSGSPLGDWHANLLSLQGFNCMLFVHDATRFPVFIKQLRKPDFAELAWHFEDGFKNTLSKLGADQTQMQVAVNAMRPLQFDSNCNRSVQGASNQRAADIEFMLARENISLADIDTYRTGAWLSEMPTKIKGMKGFMLPNKAMFALLDKLAKNSKPDTDSKQTENKAFYGFGNVVSIEKYRK